MLEIRQQALDDLRDIADYIARDNPARAETYIAEILDRIAWVGENPLLHAVRLEWKTGLRIASHGRYRILYRCDETLVVILRVVHASRDLETLLDAIR
jgi:toxin ParE1/3/4